MFLSVLTYLTNLFSFFSNIQTFYITRNGREGRDSPNSASHPKTFSVSTLPFTTDDLNEQHGRTGIEKEKAPLLIHLPLCGQTFSIATPHRLNLSDSSSEVFFASLLEKSDAFIDHFSALFCPPSTKAMAYQ